MSINDLIELRKQLFANGYQPIPNYDKQTFLKGWNNPDYAALGPIEKFPPRYKATGLRVTNNLRVIDLDIDHPLIDQVFSAIEEIAPNVARHAPARYGASDYKVALFCRAPDGDEAFSMLPVHKYLVDGKAHSIELFGGGLARSGNVYKQMGVFGPHSHNSVTKKVAFQYAWDPERPSLLETPLAELPELSKAQAMAIAAAFERIAEAAGWERVVRPAHDTGAAVYDITDLSRFDTDRAGAGLTYAELCDALAAHGELRCSANFMPDRGDSGDTSRCWVAHNPRHDGAAVFVFGDEQWHFPADAAPGAQLERNLAELQQALAGPEAVGEPPTPPDDAPTNAKAAWLVQTRAFFEGEDKVVRIYATELDCRVGPAAFARRYKAWFDPPADKRKKPIFATDLWEMTPRRINIEGVRMRPDMPFPLYEATGRLFKNTYRKPQHTAGGDVAPFLAFLEGFLPNPTERNWLLDWMAHKQARPEIPGTAVLYVADTEDGVREGSFGTGRGMLFRIAHRLYGEQYARSQTFSMLDGSSHQAGFSDWMHGAVLVTVDESKSSATAHRRGERNAAYEVLKDLVDPAPKLRNFKVKYGKAFDDMSYCSFWVATNHSDALAIPEADRRFTVLRNGRPLTPTQARAIDAWLTDDANIGALSRFLAGRDISAFDMFLALETRGKAEMAELALSSVEEILRDMMEDPERGLAFTREQVREQVGRNFNGLGGFWHGEFQGAWSKYCVGLHTEAGGPRRVRIEGTRRKLFCFRGNRRRVDAMPEAAIRREVSKWSGVESITDLLVGPSPINGPGEKDDTLQ